MEHRKSIFGPLLLIAAGVVWLMVKQDSIPTANLWALAHIWPFLLIAAGVGLILRPYWSYSNIALNIIIISGAVAAIMFAPRMGWDNPPMNVVWSDNNLYVGPTEKGSGKVTTQTREVASFKEVEVSYPAEVFISQGETESVKIEAEDNLLPGLQTRVRDGRLEIFYKAEEGKAVRPTRPVKVTIVVKQLDSVNFESAGELNISGIENDSLSVVVSGAGNLELDKVAVKDLSIILSGAGSMNAAGTADNLTMVISGFGSYDGKDLISKTASINLSGAGSATVNVEDSLDAQISGAGSVNYYGSPSVSKQISGVGGVTQVGE